MKSNSVKKIIFVILILFVFTICYFLIKYFIRDDSLEYEPFLKNYEVNEYISVYIRDEDMASIYLNDYTYKMNFNIEESYNLLDEEYRTKKFGSLSAYEEYLKNYNYESYTLDRYYKTSKDGYIIFGVYDKNGNFFGFKTNGVMQYSVFLDEDTVEIW